ncbi:hypothetical protein [Mucilaginibacter sp. FT3.2]|uniref:hypothetical protein n=1 Tax=Mucilaginibacter sp. FT3.2 TaxID=2723090 RepID=UPI00161E920A|nr:hypothetical protein [Mucilaginibacter sp. FT3.2]MBB6231129.1 hypothetical protein [Mucilaginibacter sp. FT3.2]
MEHKIILADGTAHIISITSAYFKTWRVWNIKFKDGRAATLLKMGSEWMQRNEDFLDQQVIAAIGNTIDKIICRRNTPAF